MKKIIAVFLALGMVTMASGGAIATMMDIETTSKSSVEERHTIFHDAPKIVGFKGTHYEIGYQAGLKFFDKYLKIREMIWEKAEKDHAPRQLMEDARNHIKILEEVYPQHLEKIKGLSSAIGIGVDELVALKLFAPIVFPTRCTTSGISSEATRDGHNYLTWNLDEGLPFKLGMTHHFKVESTDGYAWVAMGIPVILPMPLQNERGLSTCANIVYGQESGDGLTSTELSIKAIVMS